MTLRPTDNLALIAAHDLLPIAQAVAHRLGCRLATEVDRATTIAIVGDDRARGGGPEVVAGLLQQGAGAVIGVASLNQSLRRVALFDAGAADVIDPLVDEAELLRRIERLLALRQWSRTLHARVDESHAEADRQRALFQAVVDALPVSLHVVDSQFRVVVWNRGREAGPYGRPRGEVLGCDLFAAIGQDAGLRGEYEQIFATATARSSEVESHAGTSPRFFHVEKLPMRLGHDDATTHVITVSRDVTAERALERAMTQTEKMAAIGRLAAGIAHEIKNPLATIAGCAEAIRDRFRGPLAASDRSEIADDAAVIEGEAYRCKEILEGLLDFSRSRAAAPVPCELGALIRRAVRLLRHNPRVDELELSVDVEPGLAEPLFSEDQLLQVLLALVLNAADASPGGRVAISAYRGPDGRVRLAVEDDGPGVPPEIAQRIFEPFFTTKPPGQGTGLGLAVAYGLVEAHGATLQLISQPGHGARFEVAFPAEAMVTHD